MKQLITYMALIAIAIGYSQESANCETIQCDCANIEGGQEDQGLVDLCRYYEKILKKKCEEGKSNLKCRENAKGPNAWVMINLEEKGVVENNTKPENTTIKYSNAEAIVEAIKSSENPVKTYNELYGQLQDMRKTNLGLPLAMEITDLSTSIYYLSFEFDFALRFSQYVSKIGDGNDDMVIKNLLKALSAIGRIEIDQIDIKYKLGELFNRLEAVGYDVSDAYKAGRYSHNPKILDFIAECKASLHTDFNKSYMKQLREVSTTIYLKRMHRLVPANTSSNFTKSIDLIIKDILEWNENLLNEAVKSLETITICFENKKWDKLAVNKAFLDYTSVFNDESWVQDKNLKHYKVVRNEVPIVWNLLVAVH